MCIHHTSLIVDCTSVHIPGWLLYLCWIMVCWIMSTTIFLWDRMGGDRDGNPFVTPSTTRDVVITARLAATNLYFTQVEKLMFELSSWRCSEEAMVCSCPAALCCAAHCQVVRSKLLKRTLFKRTCWISKQAQLHPDSGMVCGHAALCRCALSSTTPCYLHFYKAPAVVVIMVRNACVCLECDFLATCGHITECRHSWHLDAV